MDPLPKRKPNRLTGYDYSQPGAYFITICAKGRHAIFGTVCVGRDDLGAPYVKLSKYGTVVENYICSIGQAYSNVTVEKFVVMPNHVHLLFAITRRESGAPRSSRPTESCSYMDRNYLFSSANFFMKSMSFSTPSIGIAL